MFKNITRTSMFWTVFAAISLAGGIVGSKLFFKTIPLMSVDITMDREQAFEKASLLAEKNNWNTQTYKQAAMFDHDGVVQFFAELEAGGIATYQQMIQDKLYAPYKWHVRFFKQLEPNETHVFFTPEGTPEGFLLKLPETYNPGNCSVSEARALALQKAQADWNVSFENYTEVEASKNTTPDGRVDHTFLYERTDATLGSNGKYRIKLVVSGTTFSQLTKSVLVPEAFQRRYEEMRSQNTLFSAGFSTLFRIVYILFGSLIGGFILIRRRRYLIKPALSIAVILGALSLLQTFNSLPLVWMHYQTSMTYSSFMWQLFFSDIIGCLRQITTFFLIIGAAEGFGRWAFDNHVQFFKSWSNPTGGSLTVLGLTLGGYGLFGIELILMSVTYYLLTHYLGWWMPTGTLSNPNILASYVPWFGAFAPSFMAGFWEECALRALPLAGAALLGRRFKKEKLFLGIMLVVQAIIFGGLHTNYVQQPVYFRIVEMFIPSVLWGAVYLTFGLLPGIICHYAWDLFCFSLPLMVAQTSGVWIQKAFVIAVGLVPLLVVLYRRSQLSSWKYATDNVRNSAWKVPTLQEQVTDTIKTVTTKLSEHTQKVALLAGACGLIVCLLLGRTSNTNTPLDLTRNQAIARAQELFATLDNADHTWKILTQSDPGTVENYKPVFSRLFIWRTANRPHYEDLLGTYLPTAHWKIRFASFEGNVAERAKEYTLFVNNQAEVFRVKQTVPEQTPGASLSQAEARGIALDAVQKHFDVSPAALKELSALDKQQPERKDWEFIFQNTQKELLEGGQARIRIKIAGDKVTDYERFVFVPEAWQRAEEQRMATLNIVKIIGFLILAFLLMLASGSAGHLLFSQINFKNILFFFVVCMAITIIFTYNSITLYTFMFTTAQPFASQLYALLAQLIGSSLLRNVLVALVVAHTALLSARSSVARTPGALLTAMGASAALCGVAVVAFANFTPFTPPIADITTLNSMWPFLSLALLAASLFIRTLCMALLFTRFISSYTQNWKQNSTLATVMILLCGIAISSLFYETVISIVCVGSALSIGLLFAHKYIFDKDVSLAIPAVGTYFALGMIQDGFMGGYPYALLYGWIIGSLLLLTSIFWFQRISFNEK